MLFNVVGRIVVWSAIALGAEVLLKKSGALETIGDAISKIGKVGTRQEQPKPGAIDKLGGKGEPADDVGDSSEG